jgi:hypothetical protein
LDHKKFIARLAKQLGYNSVAAAHRDITRKAIVIEYDKQSTPEVKSNSHVSVRPQSRVETID